MFTLREQLVQRDQPERLRAREDLKAEPELGANAFLMRPLHQFPPLEDEIGYRSQRSDRAGERPRSENGFLYRMEMAGADQTDSKFLLNPGRITAEHIPHTASRFVWFHSAIVRPKITRRNRTGKPMKTVMTRRLTNS